VTDAHIKILAMVARKSQRRLDDHDAARGTPDPAYAGQRHDLKTRAKRTRARVAAAQARRRQT
jgi:hypothetical protein